MLFYYFVNYTNLDRFEKEKKSGYGFALKQLSFGGIASEV